MSIHVPLGGPGVHFSKLAGDGRVRIYLQVTNHPFRVVGFKNVGVRLFMNKRVHPPVCHVRDYGHFTPHYVPDASMEEAMTAAGEEGPQLQVVGNRKWEWSPELQELVWHFDYDRVIARHDVYMALDRGETQVLAYHMNTYADPEVVEFEIIQLTTYPYPAREASLTTSQDSTAEWAAAS